MDASGASSSSSSSALSRWQLENNVQTLSPDELESIIKDDKDRQQMIQSQRPWQKDPHYFKNAKISALALIKMAMHARSGKTLEVMGMMLGKTVGDTFYILDTFPLPVEGTETRVNAANDANEYMVSFTTTKTSSGRPENVVGWYHSHPGYGCWLSGIDVSTQSLNQAHFEPWLAIVVDPIRTVTAGKVEIGAFRTYPEGYKPPDEPPSEYQTIPLSKVEDFGVHCQQYYSLNVSIFKSKLDGMMLNLLWNKYWINTLSSSPLLCSKDYLTGQIKDIADKMEQTDNALNSSRLSGFFPGIDKKKEESQLSKASRDGVKSASEQIAGVMTQVPNVHILVGILKESLKQQH